MKIYLSFLVLLSFNAFAINNPDHIQRGNSKAIFVDFKKVEHIIQYDMTKEKAFAKTTIIFEQTEEGTPIFDLIASANEIRVNGKVTKEVEISSPDGITKYKTISTDIGAGAHTLEIKNLIEENIRFEKGGVQSAFWMSDLSDRNYLEQYLPTNIEYDQYQTIMQIEFIGGSSKQEIFTNGSVTKLKNNTFKIEFPEYFTASSIFFHTATESRFEKVSFDYQSKSGKTIPVVIYTKSSWTLSSAKQKTLNVLSELEGKFGHWAHPSLTIYVAGQGGMEYCGATITSMSALGHELTHSYFARGVMPIDGNSGWMDEAIASWRDNDYPAVKQPNFNSTAMANHSQYRRTTDRKAYTQGANFMAYLNNNLENLGGLEAFLSKMFNKYVHTNIHTETFRKELEQFSGQNYEADFKQFIYGEEKSDKKSMIENPMHPKLTAKQLNDLL